MLFHMWWSFLIRFLSSGMVTLSTYFPLEKSYSSFKSTVCYLFLCEVPDIPISRYDYFLLCLITAPVLISIIILFALNFSHSVAYLLLTIE